MRLLTVDVGTGTQDVCLFDTALALENSYKLVMPSPTLMVRRRLRAATQRREAVLLTGWLMGGGPSQWAARDHVRAGGLLYATPEAARTFDDDLDRVQRELGVQIVSADEAQALPASVTRLELKDFDYPLLERAFAEFGVALRPDAVAVAVFDHGAAPPGCSDRQFRFDYLDARCRAARALPTAQAQLAAFGHCAEAVPADLTRLRAVVAAAQGLAAPLCVMDTAPAAVLGALLDARVAAALTQAGGGLVANVGNFHCLAFRFGPAGITGLFEHHTGELTPAKLDAYLGALADSRLDRRAVFDDMGHGALVYDPQPLPAPFYLAALGPRRALLAGSAHAPYFAAPFGDMMLAGCYGLLRALAAAYPEFSAPIEQALSGAGGRAPWEVN
ncbi:MAG: hypothetical protein IT317_23920 [Anaerolineales bacterium]|nr:hypothetical protein [Anaerolineales bacterium]